ncbi:MAG: hypothetical protein ACP5XB_06440, partial [Isosphaeraceae bacterium]
GSIPPQAGQNVRPTAKAGWAHLGSVSHRPIDPFRSSVKLESNPHALTGLGLILEVGNLVLTGAFAHAS